MRNKNSIFGIFFGLFAVIGIIFFAVGIFIAVLGNKFKRNAVEVNAVISEIESYRDSDGEISHNVYVSYSYNGRDYKDIELNEYGSNMYEGKEILIMIDPDSPRSLRTNLGIYLGPGICLHRHYSPDKDRKEVRCKKADYCLGTIYLRHGGKHTIQ